jgi:hypothetical protein
MASRSTDQQWSEDIASLIADALVDGKLLASEEMERAAGIIAKEVSVRLVLGDYPPGAASAPRTACTCMKVPWWVVRLLALGLLVVGAIVAAATGVELYLLLTGQVLPGQPIHPDALANTQGASALGLAQGLAMIAAGLWLTRLARTKAAAMRTRP